MLRAYFGSLRGEEPNVLLAVGVSVSNNDKVAVISNVGKDYIDFKVFDFDCFAMHGHQIKSTKE